MDSADSDKIPSKEGGDDHEEAPLKTGAFPTSKDATDELELSQKDFKGPCTFDPQFTSDSGDS